MHLAYHPLEHRQKKRELCFGMTRGAVSEYIVENSHPFWELKAWEDWKDGSYESLVTHPFVRKVERLITSQTVGVGVKERYFL